MRRLWVQEQRRAVKLITLFHCSIVLSHQHHLHLFQQTFLSRNIKIFIKDRMRNQGGGGVPQRNFTSHSINALMRKEYRLKVFENKILSCMFGPISDKLYELERKTKVDVFSNLGSMAHQIFYSKIPDSENILVQQLGKYLFYPSNE